MATKPATVPQPGTSPQPADGQKKHGRGKPLTPEQQAAKQKERRERFLKYAAGRVNGTLRRLKQVKALANKAGYDYTPQEAEKIMQAIAKAFQDVCQAFTGQKEQSNEFTL